ncbi:hypothetical protein P9112_012494 [Eukaryota sp. TZLM1-RC]
MIDVPRLLTLLAIVSYVVIFIAYICEHYLCPALLIIIRKLGVADDVAGALFLALATSIPELFSSVIGLFIEHSETGLTNCIGASAFNILFALGVSAVALSVPLLIDWRVLLRETFFLIISILVLLWCLAGETITKVEPLVLLIIYIIFVLALLFSKKYFDFFNRLIFKRRESSLESLKESFPEVRYTVNAENTDRKALLDHEHQHHVTDLLSVPRGVLHKLWYFFTLPIVLVQLVTIPPCTSRKTRKFWPLTLLFSIAFIGVVEYVVVEAVAEIGEMLSISDEVEGLTLLAAFSCLPEVFTSVAAVRNGMGNSVISNVFGSNVFVSTLALAVPWFIYVYIYPGQVLVIETEGLVLDAMITLGITALSFIGFCFTRFKLRRSLGVVFVIGYVAYVSFDLIVLN